MSSSKIVIRSAHYGDLEDIASLDTYIFGENAWSIESFSRELALHFSRLLVAQINLEFAGFALAWYIADEIQLLRIAVKPQYQRNKIGSLFIQHLIDLANNQNKIVLEVADTNTSAIKFYTTLGFYSVGFRKNYYRFDNAILMEKIIHHEN
jgi:ribosomal-protein-alanine N-acetyltransferase